MSHVELAEKVACAKLERKLAKLEMETSIYRLVGTLCDQGTELIPMVLAASVAAERRAEESHAAFMRESAERSARAEAEHRANEDSRQKHDRELTELHLAEMRKYA